MKQMTKDELNITLFDEVNQLRKQNEDHIAALNEAIEYSESQCTEALENRQENKNLWHGAKIFAYTQVLAMLEGKIDKCY